MRIHTKKMISLAMLSALAYLAMLFIRFSLVPSAPFLKFDPKDVIIAIGGFLYGPLYALLISVVVSFLEMITVSDSGPIGMLMNILSSAAFVCPAAILYKYKRSLLGAVIGLAAGCLSMTAVMLLWNYIMVPVYMGVPRPAVAGMLLPVFMPFNLLKSGLNAAVTMLLYKPVSAALRAARLHDAAPDSAPRGKLNVGVLLASVFMIASLVLVILILQGRF